MNKIVPILTLCSAVVALALNVIALICACLALSAAAVKLIAIPTAIVGLVAVTVFTVFAFLFQKDMLCRIAFYIDLVSLAVAIAAVAVGFSA